MCQEREAIRQVQKFILSRKRICPTIVLVTNMEIAEGVGCTEGEVKNIIHLLKREGWLNGASGAYCLCMQNPKMD